MGHTFLHKLSLLTLEISKMCIISNAELQIPSLMIYKVKDSFNNNLSRRRSHRFTFKIDSEEKNVV